MLLRVGYELIYSFRQPTPIILLVNIHHSRSSDIVVPDRLITEPSIPITGYRDAFGNECHRVLAPAGRLRLAADGIIRDGDQPDPIVSAAAQDSVQDLPEEILVFLLGSRMQAICQEELLHSQERPPSKRRKSWQKVSFRARYSVVFARRRSRARARAGPRQTGDNGDARAKTPGRWRTARGKRGLESSQPSARSRF